MALIECPPYDYNKEPLVTNNVHVNAETLKKTVRWLVDCVQDHQQILYRHSQLWDSLETGGKVGVGNANDDSISGAMSDAHSDNEPKESPSARTSPRDEINLAHRQSIDETQMAKRDSRKSIGVEPVVKYASESPTQGRKSFRRTFTEGYTTRRTSFVQNLGGELLDMKMSAMRRTLFAEQPRKGELESQREKMLADMANFTRDLNAKFAESDKKMHNDLSQATSKLYDQLTRISEDIIGRIEILEGVANANAEDLAILQESRPGTAVSHGTAGNSHMSVTSKRSSRDSGAPDQSEEEIKRNSVDKGGSRNEHESRRSSVDKDRGSLVSRTSANSMLEGLLSRPTSPTSVLIRDSQTECEADTDRGTRLGSPEVDDSGTDQRLESVDNKSESTEKRPESRHTQDEKSGGLEVGENQDMESNLAFQSEAQDQNELASGSNSRPDSQQKSIGRPKTSSEPTSSEPTSPKTPTRKPAWKPPLRESIEITQPAVPSEISSWDDVQNTLSKISAAQREGLEDARRDLADMAEALAEESEERLKLQDELDSMKKEQKMAHNAFDELTNELPGWLADELAAWQKKQDMPDGKSTTPVSRVSLKSRASRTSVASNRVGDDVAEDQPESSGTIAEKRRSTVSQGQEHSQQQVPPQQQQQQQQWHQVQQQGMGHAPPQQRQAQEESEQAPLTSLKDLLNGAVKKSTEGHKSAGVQDQHHSAVKQAFKEEAAAWLRDKPSRPPTTRNQLDGTPAFSSETMNDHLDHVANSRPNSKRESIPRGEPLESDPQIVEQEAPDERRHSAKEPVAGGSQNATEPAPGHPKEAEDTPHVTRSHSMNGSQYISSAFAQHSDPNRVSSHEGNRNLDERVRNIHFSLEQIESKHGDRISALEESVAWLKKGSSLGTKASSGSAETSADVREIHKRLNDIEAQIQTIQDRPTVKSGRALITSPRPEPTPTTSPRPEVAATTSPQPTSASPSSSSAQDSQQKGQKLDQQKVAASSGENAQYSQLRAELDLVHKKLDAMGSLRPNVVGVQPRHLMSAGSTTVGGLDTERGDASNEDLPDMTETSLDGNQAADVDRIQSGLQEMLRASEEGIRGDMSNLVALVEALQKDVKGVSGRTEGIIARLKKVERENPSLGQGSVAMALADVQATPTEQHDDVSALSARRQFPPLPALLDAALDKHPADLSHLLDPQSGGGNTPLPFVSQRGLQKAVEGLTDNFRSWLDAIYQSIIAALENKADSTQLQEILTQVNEAAGRTSESVASFAKRALGGHCASCDAPLSEDSLSWKRPLPTSSSGRWMPRASAGATHSIRPPSLTGVPPSTAPKALGGLNGSGGRSEPPLGFSKLPRLQDLRSSRDFPKGKILKASSSDPQLRVPPRGSEATDVS